jgi:hypothetical protein
MQQEWHWCSIAERHTMQFLCMCISMPMHETNVQGHMAVLYAGLVAAATDAGC